MKKNSLFIKFLISFVIAILIGILCVTDATKTLEYRLYDGMLQLCKDPEMSDDVLILQVADKDIAEIGDWPWSRDILADCLIRMKEFGTASAVFDIEYISPSPKSVSSNAENKINQQISETEMLTQQLIAALPQAVEGGTPSEELGNLARNLINEYLIPSYTELYEFVTNNVAADNDEYFARACQFFGNTWLTVNNQDLEYSNIPQSEIDYVRNRTMNYEIKDDKNYIKKDNNHTFEETYNGVGLGFTPTLHKIFSRGAGAGYTNSNVDIDGVRRRNELFYEYDGKYLGQLVFAPLMSILDATKFTRTKYSLVIHDALYPGSTVREDVKIPLDNHGCMLINWQHEDNSENVESDSKKGKTVQEEMDEIKVKRLYGINYANVYFLRNLDKTEKNIATLLNLICNDEDFLVFDEEGYPLDYVMEAKDLADFYQEILDYKEYLLSLCTGYDENGVPYDGLIPEDYDSYFGYRKEYFNAVKDFCDKNYLEEIKQTEYYQYSGDDLQEAFDDLFNTLTADIKEYLSNYDLLKEKFQGKYCIIGQTAASTTDIGAIPFAQTYSNVCIHANLMNTVLTKNFIKYYPWYFGFIFSFVLSMALLLLHKKSSTIQNLVGGVTRLVLIIAFILVFVMGQTYIPILTSVIMYNFLDFLAGAIYRYVMSSQEKKFITAVASSFANKDTVEQLRKNPELFKTEGEKKYITALFSDIQKFSTFSETITKMYPEDGANRLIGLLNEYLGAMSNEILANNGNIDKYEGDAIIAMFGAPDVMKLHGPEGWAYASLDSAIRMKKCEVEFNATHQYLFEPMELKDENGESHILKLNPFQTRIGLNSGFANVGLMGSKTDTFSKLNYTMIGDTVNLASRLEGVNKPYKSWIMCSDETWNKANSGENEGKIIARKLDQVRVVGRKTPVQLYNIVGFRNELPPEMLESIELFNEAYTKYFLKDFIGAGKLFTQSSNCVGGDDTALVLANRCKDYIENGLPEGWDGILNMTEK